MPEEERTLGRGQVPLVDVAVVVQTAADEVGKDNTRVVVRCKCRLYRAVLLGSGEREW